MKEDNTKLEFLGYSVAWLVGCGLLIAVTGGILFHSIKPLIIGWIPFWVMVVYVLSALVLLSYLWAFDHFDDKILPDEDIPPMFKKGRKEEKFSNNHR